MESITQAQRLLREDILELLESTHLIYRLPPFGYGKEVLRGRYKIYLADAAIAPAVLLKVDEPAALGIATETAVFKHLLARCYARQVKFSYWRGKRDHAVVRQLAGLFELCRDKRIDRGYVVTKFLDDIGLLHAPPRCSATGWANQNPKTRPDIRRRPPKFPARRCSPSSTSKFHAVRRASKGQSPQARGLDRFVRRQLKRKSILDGIARRRKVRNVTE